MNSYLNVPAFGIVLTVIAFNLGLYIHKRFKRDIFNPLVIAIVLIIFLLVVFNIDYETYNKGASFISFFLGPATIVLALPLYGQINKLRDNGLPVIVGILVGSLASMISIIYLSKVFKLDPALIRSLLPKSATTAISQEVSLQIGGIQSITIGATIVTGITGNLLGPFLFKLLRIQDPVAIGTALGTTSHAVGTAKAMELGELEGGMASLAIGLAGLLTVILAPLLLKILVK